MPSRRSPRFYFDDILTAITDIQQFTNGINSSDELAGDRKTLHAVLRNLEVIGEESATCETSSHMNTLVWMSRSPGELSKRTCLCWKNKSGGFTMTSLIRTDFRPLPNSSQTKITMSHSGSKINLAACANYLNTSSLAHESRSIREYNPRLYP